MGSRIYLGVFVSIFIFFISFSAVAERRAFVVGINDQDNFPAMGKSGTENKPNPGIMIEAMRFVADVAGIEVKYVRLPWKRCLRALQAGEMDGLICGSYKKEREIYGVYPKTSKGIVDRSKRFIDSSYFLYVKRGNMLIWDGRKFNRKNILIGAERGFSIVPVLKKIGVQVEEVNSVRINFIKLLTGRIDGVAAHENSGDAIMLFSPEIVKIEVPLKSKAYYLLISHQTVKKEPALAERVWNACRKLHKKELGIIKEKYRGKRSWKEVL